VTWAMRSLCLPCDGLLADLADGAVFTGHNALAFVVPEPGYWPVIRGWVA
jgi:hypothetical protein